MEAKRSLYFTRCFLILLILISICIFAEEGGRKKVEITIWSNEDGGVPNVLPHDEATERGVEIADEKEGLHVLGVHIPTLTFYPANSKNSKPLSSAVILCPGGSYRKLAFEKEGMMVAHTLSRAGVAVFILRYRHMPYKHPEPLRDALQAIRFVRNHAAAYGIDKQKIGIMGFSAGGHLAATAATLYNDEVGKMGSLSSISARPNFAILIYPLITLDDNRYTHDNSRKTLLADIQSPELLKKLSPYLNVNKDTPPMFLVHTGEDSTVPVMNSILMYNALNDLHIHVEMHIYAEGPHGVGVGHRNIYGNLTGPSYPVIREWPIILDKWLRSMKML